MPPETILILVPIVFAFVLFGVVLASGDFYTRHRHPSANAAPSNRETVPPSEQRQAA